MAELKTEKMKIKCPGCQTHLDVSDLEPFTVFACPQCGMQVKVPKWWHEYLFEDCLSSEGGVEVYRALDTALDREVEVELVTNAVLASEDEGKRYLEVIRRLAAVTDPALSMIYGCGEYEDGVYSVTQFLPEGIVPEGKQSWQEVREWFLPLLQALAKAAALSIVHGCLGPEVLRRSESGGARVTGFGKGMALACCPVPAGYASPERTVGERATLADDMYSLGRIVWRCLCGSLPEEGGHPNTDLPPAITELLARMMASSPEERPESYAEVVSAVADASATQMLLAAMAAGRQSGKAVPKRTLRRGEGASAAPVPVPKQGHSVVNVLLVLALLVLGAVGATAWWLKKQGGDKTGGGGAVVVSGSVPAAVISGDNESEDDEEEDEVEDTEGVSSAAAEAGMFEDAPSGSGTSGKAAKWLPLTAEQRARRPRPKNPQVLHSRKVRNFLATLPAEQRLCAEKQARLLEELPRILLGYTMKNAYRSGDDARDTVLVLRDGRKLRANITMANERGMHVKPLREGDDYPDSVTFKDLSRRTVGQMLSYYLAYSVERLDKKHPDYVKTRRGLSKQYIVLAMLCDWYGETSQAAEAAAKAAELEPKSKAFLEKFGIGGAAR